MASTAKLQRHTTLKCTLILTLCFLIFANLPSNSVGKIFNRNQGKEMKMVLGSRPPRCINRCMNCRPCMAVLVIPPHRKMRNFWQEMQVLTPQSQVQEEEGYYLLSWKCRCKNKLFQP